MTPLENDISTAKPRMPRLIIQVTQKEIDTAIPSNSGHCMIADAAKACFKKRYGRKPARVTVDLQTLRISDNAKSLRYIYLTPKVAQRALVQFDQGIRPTEFKFRLQGGQIVTLHQRKKKELSSNRKASLGKARHVRATNLRQRKSAELNLTNMSNVTNTRVATKIGGKTPPVAVLAGNRRQFGVRSLGDISGPTQPHKSAEQ